MDAFKSRRILQVDAAGKPFSSSLFCTSPGLDYDYPTSDYVATENETEKNSTEQRKNVIKVVPGPKLKTSHQSIMPESPEEHLKLLALKQGEM